MLIRSENEKKAEESLVWVGALGSRLWVAGFSLRTKQRPLSAAAIARLTGFEIPPSTLG